MAHPWLLSLIVLQLLDAASTVIGLRMQGVAETNTLMRPLFARFGVLPVLLCAKVAMISAFVYSRDVIPAPLMIVANLVYAAVVINNLRVILRLRAENKATP